MKEPGKKKKRNIRILIGELVVALFIYFAAVMTICYVRFSNSLEQGAKEDLNTYFTSVARDFAGKLRIERNSVETVTNKIVENSFFDSVRIKMLLEAACDLNIFDDAFAYVDKNGMIVCGDGVSEEQIIKMQQYIEGWTVPEYDICMDAGNVGHLMVNSEITGEDGNPFAVVSSVLNCFEYKKTIDNCGSRHNIMYLLTDYYGNIYLQNNRAETYVLSEKNLFDSLLKSDISPGDLASVRSNIRIKTDGWKNFTRDNKEYVVFYNYTNFENLFVVGIAEQSEIRKTVNFQLSSLTVLIRHICLGCFAFLVAYIIFMFKDRQLYDEEKKELQDQSETDKLTGLLNKMATEEHIAKYLESARKDQMGALFLIDLDNFKKINDTLGHAFGDEVLKNLGHALRKEFRVEDIVGRIGGDEFIVYIVNVKSSESIKKEAVRLERFFKSFRVGEYVKYAVTASVGIAFSPNDGNSFKELYLRADQALYYSKDAGKNRISFYDGNVMKDTSLPKNRNHDEIES